MRTCINTKFRPVAMVAYLLGGLLAITGCSGQQDSPSADATPTGDGKQHYCLALAMYWEAKAEGDRGMLAVGQVVLNRAQHPSFPDTLCGVVQEGGEAPPCQFSWWCDGRSDTPTEKQNWLAAQGLAQRLLTSKPTDQTKGALFFHATRLRNTWHQTRTKTVTIGGHVFYK